MISYIYVYMPGVETPTIDGRCNEEIVKASGKMVSGYMHASTFCAILHGVLWYQYFCSLCICT